MLLKHAALKLGLRLIQSKLGQAMGDPSFGASDAEENKETTQYFDAFTPMEPRRTAKLKAPKIINTR